MLDVVIDTNLFVRALLRGPITLPLIEAWRARRFRLITSEELIAELVDVVGRPRLREYFSKEDVRELLDLIAEQGTMVSPEEHVTLCRDPKDSVFLDVAIVGDAQYLVTGDDDLKGDEALKTTMREKYGVEIVGVGKFLALLESQ